VLDQELIEEYRADQADRWKPSTVASSYRSLQQFTRWLAAEGGIDARSNGGHARASRARGAGADPDAG
jgi:hypothetical protein